MRSKALSGAIVLGTVLAVFGSMTFSTLLDEPTEAPAFAAALPAVPSGADGVGLVDPTTGIWHLRTRDGDPASFYFGNPGDFPIMGDWNCDGIDTPGLYRQSDGYVYLRNSNTQGVADIKFFFGNPGDIPLAGDFNGDGCDTVSIYRPTEARIYIINELGSNDGGLGAAEYSYLFGNPGDKPFTGDFNNNGIDTVGLHRESTGFMYFRNTNTTGIAHYQFYFGDPGDRLVAGNWLGNGEDYPAVYRPSNRTVYMRHSNTQGNADEWYQWGESPYIPVAGRFGDLIPDPVPASCSTFPADNIWNQRVDTLPLDPRSDQYISSIGASDTLHADFGSGVWPPGSNSPIGIPFVEVPADQPKVQITYTAYGDESDPGPFPIPTDAPVEGGPDATGDRHVIVVDRAACVLYELFNAFVQGDGSWAASSGAVYDLKSNALRPEGWTSADAAGLPIYPGLVTYDEVASGVIAHAIRFTAPDTANAHVWPARHDASSLAGTQYPPMGQRFRLKAGYDISGYSPEVRVILQAFKDYGLVLADNGASWFISGAPDPRWDNTLLHEWDDIPGSAFEAVDVSSLMVDPDSGRTPGA
jgi:hypothetical protein